MHYTITTTGHPRAGASLASAPGAAAPLAAGRLLRPLGLADRHDRTGLDPDDMTPALVVAALRSAASGDLGPLHTMFMRMEASDSRIQGHRRSLEGFLVSSPLRLSMATSGTAEAKRAGLIGEEVLRRFDTRLTIRTLMSAYLTGVRLHEVLWSNVVTRSAGPLTIPVGLRLISPSRYMVSLERDAPDFGRMRYRTEEEPDGVRTDNAPVGKILETTDAELDGLYDVAGVYRSVLFWHLAKTKNRSWWAEFNELFGLPTTVARADVETGSEAYRALMDHIRLIQRARTAILPESVEIEHENPVDVANVQTYAHFIALCNEETTIAMLGQTETSSGGKYGSNAKASVHNAVRYEIGYGVATMIAESITKLIKWAVYMSEGTDFPEEDLPFAYIAIPRPTEARVKAETFAVAKNKLGMDLKAQQIYDELGLEKPLDGDEVLKGLAIPVASPGERTPQRSDEDYDEDYEEDEEDDDGEA